MADITYEKPVDPSDVQSILQYCVDHLDALDSLDGLARIVQDLHSRYVEQGWRSSISAKQGKLVSFAFAVVCRKYPLRPQSALDRMRAKKASLEARTRRAAKAKRTRECLHAGQPTVEKSKVIDSYETTVNVRKNRTLRRRNAEFISTARQQKGAKK